MNFSDLTLAGWIDILASSQKTPAGGSLAYLTLASNAALFAKIVRFNGADPAEFIDKSALFLSYAQRDSEGYIKTVKASDKDEVLVLLKEEIERAEAAMAFIETVALAPAPTNKILAPDQEAVTNLSLVCANTILEDIDNNIAIYAKKGGGTLSLVTKVNLLKSRLAEYRERFEYHPAG